MSITDSKANFEAGVLQLIISGGVDTIAKFAFVSSFVPGGAETPFVAAIKSLLSRDPTVGELSVLRRLSYSLTAAELRQQVERTADAPAKQLAAPDRADRLKKQKALYPGLSIQGPNEPSDRLVDRCVQIYEMNRLVHVPLNFCASKDDEIRNHKDKEDRLLSVDATGQIHIKNAAIKVEADLSSDLLVRFALTRRGLALEQAGLLSYELHEKWAEKLINSRYRELPTGYARISTQQILQADKQAFIVAADMCRAGIQLEAAGRPLDRVWDSVITHAEVAHLLLPLPVPPPAPSASRPERSANIYEAGKGKGKKGKGSRGGQKGANARVPDDLKGCHSCTSKGNPICFDHQRGNCQRSVTLNRCARGLHVCGICFANNHTMQNCNKRNAVE